MLFNSLAFLIFFPLVTALYFMLPHRARVWLLLAASCLFYMWFVPHYILILGFTILIDYFAGIWIENAPPHRKKLLLCLSLIANIGVLAVFKYFNFLNGNLAALAQALDWNYGIANLEILLPIGLSFHTFQAMSYTIEVSRGHQKAERDFGIYALYVMFYPQLVAGPIERPQNLLHQFREPKTFSYADATIGLRLMVWGFFLKCFVADRLALLVNQAFAQPEETHAALLILSSIFFSFQIYGDFAGYSLIAIGSARVMGFRLMQNFDAPYFSSGIGIFWRRWHISLSTWFRDYVFVPLGGSRVPLARRCLNLMVVFALSGLWHGASWTFVTWGVLHGLAVIFELLVGNHGDAPKSRLDTVLSALAVFVFVTIAWVFFRAESFTQAWSVLSGMFSNWDVGEGVRTTLKMAPFSGDPAGRYLNASLIAIALMLAGDALMRAKPEMRWLSDLPWWLRWPLYYVLVFAIVRYGVFGQQQFIYFQF
jgi:alginate O-acetyltransferase complex protein AlgI